MLRCATITYPIHLQNLSLVAGVNLSQFIIVFFTLLKFTIFLNFFVVEERTNKFNLRANEIVILRSSILAIIEWT